MKTLIETTTFVSMAFGQQEIKQTVYRKNRFVLWKEFSGEIYAYNNMVKKLVKLDFDEVKELSNLPESNLSVLAPLIKNWFLVPENFDEEVEMDRCFEISQIYIDSSFYNNYIILPTSDCNARCYYCFEHGIKKIEMSNKVSSNVADYILKNCNGKKVSIKWFGGEPLCNTNAIDIICKKLKDKCIDFSSSMVSNGYLMNDETVAKAVSLWNLKSIQISIDGTEKEYNRIKAYIYKDANSPFIQVTNNIESLMNSGVKVSVRLNVSEQNKDDIITLIDWLNQRYSNKKNLRVYCSNLFDLKHTLTSSQNAERLKRFVLVDDYLLERGLKNYSLKEWLTDKRGCMAQDNNSIVIAPDGKLGKCEHYSEGEKMFGSIYDENINYKSIDYWKKHKRISACKGCLAYPNCYGIGNCPDVSLMCDWLEKPIKERNLNLSVENAIKSYICNEEVKSPNDFQDC